ncbi:hypothetical protein [Streptomyces reniochalinae]|uniref:Lantibiotic dehydratase N-terminal domain-containing protein n=1 Tax=Streptomyces reniochalinae TaxID=2250578 RepID=A0A367EBI6_9ACTN|nr:hypothetical protein [Streptomyces reniochalinae]RCG14600.1 hypothetical protein DQ392_26050 [Streptomyces reniochalinae]
MTTTVRDLQAQAGDGTAHPTGETGTGPASGPGSGAATASLTPRLGGVAVTRVAGLPAAFCPRPTERTAALLDERADAQAALQELRPRVEDALYALVPVLDAAGDGATSLRRKVLAARRAAHRLAPFGWDETTGERVAAHADEETREALARWQTLTSARQASATALDAALADDRAAAEETLSAALEAPGFADSLALATPDWVRYGNARRTRKRQRALRTLYSYTVRAAAKTSPFARLTTVGVPGRGHAGHAVHQVSATVALTALYALARAPQTAPLLRYRPAPVRPATARTGPGEPARSLMLHPEYVATGGVTWRNDHVVEAGAAADWARALARAGDDDGSLGHAAVLRTLGGADPFGRFRRLLDTGVLSPLAPWQRGEDAVRVLSDLTSHLEIPEPPGAPGDAWGGDGSDPEAPGPDFSGLDVVRELRVLEGEREAMADDRRSPSAQTAQTAQTVRGTACEAATDAAGPRTDGPRTGGPPTDGPRRRAAAVARVRELGRGWARAAGWDRFEPTEVWYEDAACDLRLPPVLDDPGTAADLRGLGEALRPRLFRSHLYDELVRRFVADHGSGGTCEDVLGFAMRCGAETDRDPGMERAVRLDLAAREDPAERAWLPVGPSSASPSAALLVQHIAPPPDGTDGVEGPRLVVNQFNPGTGGLLTRFKGLLGEDFADALRSHVRRLWPHAAHHHELVLWTECGTAQAQSAGLLPPLTLPGELDGPGALDLTEVRLVHDPRQDTLTLLAPDGLPLAAAYTGLVPTHLFPKFARFLAVLSDPWVNGSPLSDYRMPFQLPREPDRVVALERRTLTAGAATPPDGGEGDDGATERGEALLGGAGGVVTRRAQWTVPVGHLPLLGADATDAETVAAADAFRRRHGMPRELFAYLLPASGGMSPDHDRKPLWIRLDSAVSLDVLAHWITPDTGHLRLVEALPAHHQHPLRDADGERRAAEHAVLLHWADGEEDR